MKKIKLKHRAIILAYIALTINVLSYFESWLPNKGVIGYIINRDPLLTITILILIIIYLSFEKLPKDQNSHIAINTHNLES